MIFYGVGQGKVVISHRGHITILDQGVVEMAVEASLDLVHILQYRNTADTDLLPLLLIGLWFGHFFGQTLRLYHEITQQLLTTV